MSVSEGTHTWNINCTDNSSMYNTNATKTRTFYIDITNPSATINNPNNKTYTKDTTPEFNITAIDNMDSQLTYKIFVDGVYNSQTGPLNNNTKTAISIDTLSETTHEIIFEITDEAERKIQYNRNDNNYRYY